MTTAIENKFSLALFRYLDGRRKELGMSMRILAQRSGLGMRTVQRVLSGNEPNPTINTVLSIAQALRVELQPRPRKIVSARLVRREQAERKATELASMVQGTSALEAQAVPKEALLEIREEIADKLAAGSRRQLWSS